jgi:hypothetical protein
LLSTSRRSATTKSTETFCRTWTAEDLIAIGVTPVGHRRKLLSAIAALGAAEPAPALIATPASGPPPAPAPAQAERRQLTVMFCDLVGSTALSTDRRQHNAAETSIVRGQDRLRRLPSAGQRRQLRKCRVHRGCCAWCQIRTFAAFFPRRLGRGCTAHYDIGTRV